MTTVGSGSAARLGAADTVRPELTVLTDEQKHGVLREVRRRYGGCRYCGGEEFLVGDALYLGFLFLSEDTDAYMVALICTNLACSAPHTGIRLHRSEFQEESPVS
ncbi:MAG: hypothetical protein JO281_22520 [Pseudonocardiales bacterium]|nr:hypothetical protein [Pseudonocardiales bacterium]